MEGITFLGKHSYRDFGLTLAPGRSIGEPDKKKKLVPAAFSNIEYDFSEIYGDQTYEKRSLSYPFNVYIPGRSTKQAMTIKKTAVSNWLMSSSGKQPLYDDAMPGYYFMAEVEDGASFDENYSDGILTVTFQAYPFRISILPEGHDIWDEIIFDLDVFQDVKFEIERLPFVPVEIGSMATLTAWASKFTGGKPIKRELVGHSYKVLDVKEASSSESKRTYKLEGLSEWVVEQDIVQAQGDGHEITLYNPGTPSVTPIITTTYPTSIVFGNTVYNAWEGSGTSERFLLKSGENKLKLYTFEPATIEFEFYKELI